MRMFLPLILSCSLFGADLPPIDKDAPLPGASQAKDQAAVETWLREAGWSSEDPLFALTADYLRHHMAFDAESGSATWNKKYYDFGITNVAVCRN